VTTYTKTTTRRDWTFDPLGLGAEFRKSHDEHKRPRMDTETRRRAVRFLTGRLEGSVVQIGGPPWDRKRLEVTTIERADHAA